MHSAIAVIACVVLLAACGGEDRSATPPRNVPPVAVISTLPGSVLENEPVTLDASGSSDADGRIVRYAWHVDDELVHVGTAPRAPNPLTLSPGSHVIRLTVTDDDGGQHTSEHAIRVQAAPVIPPVAVISALPESVLGGEPVTLDGSGSSDADGRIVRYAWHVDDELVYEGTASRTPEPVALSPGNRVIRLTVTDDDGGQHTSEHAIRVDAAPVAPVAVISTLPGSVLENEPVTLDASGSSDADGRIVRYAWHVDDELVYEGTASRTPEPVALSPGSHVIRLTVTDDDGNEHASEHAIRVDAAPVAPVAVISTLPGSVLDSEPVTLDGSGSSDADGRIVRYAWHVDDELVHEGTAPRAPNPLALSPGSHVIRLTVTDDDGNQNSIELAITVAAVPKVIGLKIGGNPWHLDNYLSILVEFSDTLVVRGKPTLVVNIDGVDERAFIFQHADTALFVSYEMEPTAGYHPEKIRLEADAFSLNGGSIENARGVAANLDLSGHTFEIPERLPDAAITVITGTQEAIFYELHARITVSIESIDEPTDDIQYTWWLDNRYQTAGYYNGDPTIKEYYLEIGRHQVRILIEMGDGRFYLAEKTIVVEPDASSYDISLHGDNIIVLNIPKIPTFLDILYTGNWGWVVYNHFQDDFDFLIFIANKERRENESYRAAFDQTYRSEMVGITDEDYLRFPDKYGEYGSTANLQGVINVVTWEELGQGNIYRTLLHEIMHNWGNYIIVYGDGSTYGDGHFWFASTQGMLGGFVLENLQREPQHDQADGLAYTAGAWFSATAPPGIQVYSPLELYLAGFIPIDEVPDIWVAPDAYFLRDGSDAVFEDGHYVFVVPEWEIYTPTRFTEEFGHREPRAGMTQTEFRAAVILLTDDQHPATEEQLRKLDDLVTQFSAPNILEGKDDDDFYYLSNFYEATGGRGRMRTDGLAASRKAVPSLPHVPLNDLRFFAIRSPDHPDGSAAPAIQRNHGKRLHSHGTTGPSPNPHHCFRTREH